ncbi:calcyclin-binding protein [Schistocerca americana]|uniref:calcyclin-binding protein n=1 Tax=Schistocerca americana TaxID=7009 RepID=UPI001F4FF08C|nr:calcyclin-binding protein [Schistocerca americana]XP_046984856.1 calcyclin-binding protein [Schistocerca americana]XP_047102047.1 calcyclin-binding protein [Schistocerca piceifrons]XP_049782107.1 calcyclin-binding protein [Schistocerca cancellata]XP_049953280.1 calcyclin-binding protein [Schistocerca serialis cubense]
MSVNSRMEQLQATVEELKRLSNLTERQKVKDILLVEARKIETEISLLREQSGAEIAESSSGGARNAPARCYDVRLTNYAWDQSDKYVKIYVTLKNLEALNETNIECVFTERSFSLKVNGLDGKNYILNICNLLEKIIVAKCYWKKKGDTLIVFLAKKSPGANWSHMTSVEKKASEPKVPKLNHSDDPSAGLMDMMKQMYQEGDDEMKRTIAKAWAESRDKQFPH